SCQFRGFESRSAFCQIQFQSGASGARRLSTSRRSYDARVMPMDLGIRGRTAVVCASSRGLGRACATELARAGCTVVINGRDRAILDGTASEIRSETGATVIPIVADVASHEGQAALFRAVPQIDILVTN